MTRCNHHLCSFGCALFDIRGVDRMICRWTAEVFHRPEDHQWKRDLQVRFVSIGRLVVEVSLMRSYVQARMNRWTVAVYHSQLDQRSE